MLISDEEYILSLKGENFDLTEFLLSVCYIFTKSDSQVVRKIISAHPPFLPFPARPAGGEMTFGVVGYDF